MQPPEPSNPATAALPIKEWLSVRQNGEPKDVRLGVDADNGWTIWRDGRTGTTFRAYFPPADE